MPVNKKVNKHTRKNRFKKGQNVKNGAGRRSVWPWIWAVFGISGFCLMGLAFIFAYDALTQCDYFSAESIEVNGARHLSKKAVLEAAGLEEGANIVAVNLSLTRRRLEAAPWISSAAIQRELPARLTISVKEHEPLAVLDVGRFFLIDREGGIFKEADPSELDGLPIISGVTYAGWKKSESPGENVYKEVMALLMVIDKQRGVFAGESVEEISVDPEMGLTLRAGLPVTIHLGYDDYALKLRRVKRILAHIRGSQSLPAFKTLDANNPKRIVATPEDRNSSEDKKEV